MTPTHAPDAEIAASIRHAGQRGESRQLPKALYGLTRTLVSRHRTTIPQLPPSQPLFIVSNPKRQGAKVAAALHEAIPGLTTIADATRQEGEWPLDVSFPGPSPTCGADLAALLQGPRWQNTRAAWRAMSTDHDHPDDLAPAMRFFLHAAQRIRYAAAHTMLSAARPPIVLVDFDRSIFSRPFVYWARQLGIPTATLVHGVPNAWNYVPVIADAALVWGTVQQDWFACHGATAHPVGRPDFTAPDTTADQAVRRVIIVHSRETLAADEITMLRDIIHTLRSEGTEVNVRLHPSTHIVDPTWQQVVDVADSLDTRPGSLVDLLGPGDAVLGVQSTAILDAMAAGAPAQCVATATRDLPADLNALALNTLDAWKQHRWATPETLRSSVCAFGVDATRNIVDYVAAHSLPDKHRTGQAPNHTSSPEA